MTVVILVQKSLSLAVGLSQALPCPDFGHCPSKLLNFQAPESQRDFRSLCLTFLICKAVLMLPYKVFVKIK